MNHDIFSKQSKIKKHNQYNIKPTGSRLNAQTILSFRTLLDSHEKVISMKFKTRSKNLIKSSTALSQSRSFSQCIPIETHIFNVSNIIPPALKGFEKCITDDFVTDKVMQSLDYIFKYVSFEKSNFEKFSIVNNQILTSIKIMIEENIFRERVKIPEAWIHSESLIESPFTHMQELQKIYNILLFLIRSLPKHEVRSWMFNENIHFLKKLIKLIGTPDATEQVTIVSILKEIMLILPKTKKIIFDGIMNILIDFNEGELRYHYASGSLKLLKTMLKSKDIQQLFCKTHSFKQIILPLFRSEFLHLFYYDLNAITNFIMKNEFKENISKYAHYNQNKNSEPTQKQILLKYLLQHWPNSNSKKQYHFLHQIISVATLLGSYDIPNIKNDGNEILSCNFVLQIANIIEKCIVNSNMNVVAMTLHFLDNHETLKKISLVSFKLIGEISRSLEQLEKQCSDETILKLVDDASKTIHFVTSEYGKDTFKRSNNRFEEKIKKTRSDIMYNREFQWEEIQKHFLKDSVAC